MARYRPGDSPSASPRRPVPPLDAPALERLALRYVERFQTTRAKLAQYLARKVRERGWDGAPADPAAIAERFAAQGYVDDRAFAEAKAASLGRRGLGARRVAGALLQAGVGEEDRDHVAAAVAADAREAALRFARRKRIGPFATTPVDRAGRERQLAQMLRAGHPPGLARAMVHLQPGEEAAIDDLD